MRDEEVDQSCEQCGALPGRLTCMGENVCRICSEAMLGAFDDGYTAVTKEQTASILRTCTTREGSQLMALLSGLPPVFTRRKWTDD